MQKDKSKRLKYSELLAVWKSFGLSRERQTRNVPAVILKEHGDCLTCTTEELIDASIMCELDGDSYLPPSSPCEWCSGGVENCDKYWVQGHRQGWWVCSVCKWVFPCRHEGLEGIDELKMTGTCLTCGMRMPLSFVAEYLHNKYTAKAEHFRMNADSLREQEKSHREWEKSRRDFHCDDSQVLYTRVPPGFNVDDWGI